MVVVIKELLRSFLGSEGLHTDADEFRNDIVGIDLIALERDARSVCQGCARFKT
jgi:hypothetical protein